MRVEGRVVVITGAARGIGRAMALRFAAQGARIAATDVLGEEVALVGADLGDGHLALPCDVTDVAQLEALLRHVEERLGPVSVFCANAGVAQGGDPVSTPPSVWERSWAVNVAAHVIAARALLPGWLERGEGYFVATASAAGLLTQIGSAPYAVSKHAAVAFAEWLSLTYGDRGVRVSCVCPMGVRTAMLEEGADGALNAAGARAVRQAGTVVEPDDVAQLVLEAMEAERFLVLPHPEVHTFLQRKAADHDRWLAGMRRLQAVTEVPA